MSDCAICRDLQSSGQHNIFEDEHWRIRHSNETNIAGYVILESKRHFLDLSFASAAEINSYGPVLARAIGAVRDAVKPERVYTFTLSEAVPHFHVHIIPRNESTPRMYKGRGILSYPLSPTLDDSLKTSAINLVKGAFNRRN